VKPVSESERAQASAHTPAFAFGRARNAPFDDDIDAQLMALATAIDADTFPPVQDYRDLHPGEPDDIGHLGPDAVRASLQFARPRYNLMVQLLRPFSGAAVADISPGFGFLDVLLTERYGFQVIATEHPQNFPAYTGLLRNRGITVLPWELVHGPCPLRMESQDVVIFAEVLEHLKLAPRRALERVLAPLRSGGHLLLTTPNIARQANIDALISGENILEPFREDVPDERDVTDYVSHIREYTAREIVELVEGLGCRVVDLALCNWMEVPLDPRPLRNHYICLLAAKGSG
jgi:2-polyprenyl-3-methyl-5-hydroxy-6-metoxy-1,4-benzoquinol methylase